MQKCKKSHLSTQPGYACNPLTGNWIKIGGKVYLDLINQGVEITVESKEVAPIEETKSGEFKVSKSNKYHYLPCSGVAPTGKVCNPLNGQWIEKCSSIYQSLVTDYIIKGNGELVLPKPILPTALSPITATASSSALPLPITPTED